MFTTLFKNKGSSFQLQSIKLILLVWLTCAATLVSMAQEMTQNAVSNGANLTTGGDYTGYASAGQMGTYLYSNGSVIVTSGIILNEMSSDVEFTFELNGNLTENEALKSGEMSLKSAGEILAGTPLTFVTVYLIDAETGEIFASTETDANGYYKFPAVPYRNFYFTIYSPEVPPEPVLLTFESNIFIEEVVVNAEIGGESLTATIEVTPANSCNPDNPDYRIWYLDYDNDGYGNSNIYVGQCTEPLGYVANDLDCNDKNALINPDATDVPGSGIDANCDGIVPCSDLTIINFSAPVDPVKLGEEINVSAEVAGTSYENISWDWGDGNISKGNYQNGFIIGSHYYNSTGVYTVQLTLRNNCGESNIFTYKYIVIFDPNAGFVTGSGLIYSPAGASTLYPNETGLASFGFVSKYDKKTENLKGNTEFEFEAGNLEFLSTEYDWLVISGDKAKFKGRGTVNGQDGYQFMISAIDGNKKVNEVTDKFRIKIWNEFTGTVIYDNEMTSEPDEDPSTSILEGSIIIHNPKEKSGVIVQTHYENQGESLVAYPNPTTDKLTVLIENPENKTLRLSVKNVLGQQLYTVKDKNQILIDLSGKPAGIYFLEALMDSQKITKKIILTKN